MPAGIPTVASLRRARARLDRSRLGANRVLRLMRDGGLALHHSHERAGDAWWLSDGTRVTSEIAKLVVANVDIASNGDGLFCGLGQTFRVVTD